MIAKGYIYVVFISAIAVTGCKKPYTPSIVASDNNYLVVDGIINTGPDSTIVNLSRTVNVSDKVSTRPELGAQVVVESDQKASYPLKEIGNGKYGAVNLNLNTTSKYDLKINT